MSLYGNLYFMVHIDFLMEKHSACTVHTTCSFSSVCALTEDSEAPPQFDVSSIPSTIYGHFKSNVPLPITVAVHLTYPY